jgi:hypothetical protein
MPTADRLSAQAEKLANGKAGHSPTPKPGFLKHRDGRWRDPALHAKVIATYTAAIEADAASGNREGFSLFRRGLEHLYVGHYDLSRQDLDALRAMGSKYADGSYPIWLALAAGDKAEAKRCLEIVNAANKAKGRPRNSLSDYE